MSLLPHTAGVPWFHPPRLLLNALVVFLIAYVAVRAAYVSITHDEAFTFFNYLKRPIAATLKVTYTNNHLLNSLLARGSSYLFGDSEFALRLPNVLGGAAFFIFGAKLLSRLHANRWMVLIAFVLLTFNTFVNDFFGICRGYGLSLGLLMTALYYQYCSFTAKRALLYESLALLFSAAAVVANYTLFNFFLLHAAFNLLLSAKRLIALRNDRKALLRSLPACTLFVAGIAVFVSKMLAMLLNLNKIGSLNFGGSEGVWKDTVGSLSVFSCFPVLRGNDWIGALYVPGCTALVLLIAAVLCIRFLIRRNFSANEWFQVFLFIAVTGCGLAIYLQNKIMNIPISRDRTVIYFIPLFYLLAIGVLLNNGRLKWLQRTAVVLFFLPMVVSQAINFNVKEVASWWGDAEMREATDIIIAQAAHTSAEKHPAVVAVTFDMQPAFNYYLYLNHCHTVQPVLFNLSGWWLFADYAIDDTTSTQLFPDSPYTVIGTAAKKEVLQRQTPVRYGSERQLGVVDFESNAAMKRPAGAGYNSTASDYLDADHDFSLFLRDTAPDTIALGHVYLFSCELRPEKVPGKTFATMVVERDSQVVIWKEYDCISYLRAPGEWQHVEFLMHPGVEILPGDILQFFILRQSDEIMLVDDLRVTEFRVE
jgi:hypothetical protein